MQLKTIGYEGATTTDFLATLQLAGVTTLVDIREVPASRRAGFSKSQLRSLVEASGIRYIHLVGLGDPKSGRDAARQGRMTEFRQIFARKLRSAEAQADLQSAVNLAREGTICLLCYERQPEFCHRSMVADAVADITGVEVSHLGVRVGLVNHGRDKRSGARSSSGQGAASRK